MSVSPAAIDAFRRKPDSDGCRRSPDGCWRHKRGTRIVQDVGQVAAHVHRAA